MITIDYGSDTLTELGRARALAVMLENELEQLRDAARAALPHLADFVTYERLRNLLDDENWADL